MNQLLISQRIFAFLMAAALLLSSCSREKSAQKLVTGGPTEKKEVDFYIAYTPGSVGTTPSDPISEAFNMAQDEIFVNIHLMPNTEGYEDKMTVLMASNGDVDAMTVNGVRWLSAWGNLDVLAPLNDLIENSGFDIEPYGSVFQASKINGNYLALARRIQPWLLFYNRGKLKEYGIDEPNGLTWDEFFANCRKMSSGEGINRKYGQLWSQLTLMPYLFASQRQYYLFDDDVTPLMDSLKNMNQMFNVDRTTISLAEQKAMDSSAFEYFASGNCAYYINGSWTLAFLANPANNVQIDWGVDFLPIPSDGSVPGRTTVGGHTYISIFKGSKDKESAFKFISWFCGEEGGKVMARNGTIPAYMTDATKAAYLENLKEPTVAKAFEGDIVAELPMNILTGQITSIFYEEAEPYLLGEQTLEQTKNKFLSRRAALIAEKK
jgi:multiple sugar transport system substrate-binding protein